MDIGVHESYFSYGDKGYADMVTNRVWNYGESFHGHMVTAFLEYGLMVTANLGVTICP